jgi:excisionase family DNA binding protein
MNARGSTQQVGQRHVADEFARAAIEGRAAGYSARTRGPDAAEGRAVPAQDGSRLNDDEDVVPAGPRPRERDPEEPVGPVERRARAATLKNGQLLAEGEILQRERAASSERRPGCRKHGDQEREHAPIYQFERRCANQRNAKDLARIEFWRTTGRGQLLKVAEVAKKLGVCSATVYRLCESGALPHVRVVNSIRVRPRDLAEYLGGARGRGVE